MYYKYLFYDYLVITLCRYENTQIERVVQVLNENVINELVKRKVITDTFRRLNSEKKEKLYKTALALFGKYGYDGLSVDQYCLQTKISKGSFFQYFPSKTHLLEFSLLIFDDRLETLVENIRRTESKVLARDRIKFIFVSAASKSALEDIEKKFYLFAANALNHSAVTVVGINIGRHINEYMNEIIKRGVETGEIRADLPAVATEAIVVGTFNSMLGRYFLSDSQPDDATVRSFISILFDGITR